MTYRYPRSLTQAFGTYADRTGSKIDPIEPWQFQAPANRGYSIEWWVCMIGCAAVAIGFALWG